MSNLMQESFMNEAIKQAELAYKLNEIPVGAIVTKQKNIIGVGHNQSISKCDPTAHAEIIAIKEAARTISNYRLINCDLYVTLEPCIMCLGAIFHSRIKNLYFSAYDYKTGACASSIKLANNKKLNHHCSIHSGIAESKSQKILQDFFEEKRAKKNRKL
jgi:tRNA(adenine34) deaminase